MNEAEEEPPLMRMDGWAWESEHVNENKTLKKVFIPVINGTVTEWQSLYCH